MSLILYTVGQERLQLFALELGNIAAFDFVYTLASTNINESAPNLVKMYTTIRSHMSGVRGCEVERRPCNHEVPSSSPGSGSQLWDFSLAHTFGASRLTGVVPTKQNRERLV